MSSRDAAAVKGAVWGRRTEKVAEQLAREIVAGIADKHLVPGTALESEGLMIDRYQVSRASLREALRILETLGLIIIKPGPGGGPLVADIDSADFGRMATLYFQVLGVRFSELVEARLIIEPMMAALAAERANRAANKQLSAIAEAGRHADEPEEWVRLSDAFHVQVLSMSGNRLLELVGRALKDIYTDRVKSLILDSERDHVRDVHDEIAEAISTGDADLAHQLMEDHMREYARNVAKRQPTLMDEVVDWR